MNSRTNWGLEIDPTVFKTLDKLPRKDAKRIFVNIELLSIDPFAGDIQKMRGDEDVWRKRVGSYRASSTNYLSSDR